MFKKSVIQIFQMKWCPSWAAAVAFVCYQQFGLWSVVQTQFLPRCVPRTASPAPMATMASLSAACGFFAAALVLCRRRRRGKALSDASGPDISGSAWDRFKLFTCMHRWLFRVFLLEFFDFIAGVGKKTLRCWTVFSVPMETTMVETRQYLNFGISEWSPEF